MTFPFDLPRPQVILAIIRRDFVVMRSYRLAFFLDIFFSFINLVIYYFISRTFPPSRFDLNGAPTYFAFAAVGVTITTVMQTATSGLAARMREEQLVGTLEVLTAHPIRLTELSLGMAGFPSAFAMARVALYLLVANLWLGLDLSRPSWVGFVLTLGLTGTAMMGLGVTFAGMVLIFKQGGAAASAVMFGMGLASGAFFPIAVLPGWLEPVGRIVPTRFAFQGVREALFRGGDWSDDALALLVLSALGLPVALWLFRGALSYAQRVGSLSQY